MPQTVIPYFSSEHNFPTIKPFRGSKTELGTAFISHPFFRREKQLTKDPCCSFCCCSYEQFGFANNRSSESKLKHWLHFKAVGLQTFLPYFRHNASAVLFIQCSTGSDLSRVSSRKAAWSLVNGHRVALVHQLGAFYPKPNQIIPNHPNYQRGSKLLIVYCGTGILMTP